MRRAWAISTTCAVALWSGCPAENWTGKSPLLRNADTLNLLYREYQATKGAPGEFIAYSLTVAAGTDRLTISALPTRAEWSWDDGWPPDRFAGDNEHTGHYRVAQRRRDANWVFKTRPGQSGEPVKTMPPEQERTNPYANRRFMGGGAGGAVDNASVCPPGYVMTGVRGRMDLAGKTVAQLAALCRALPRPQGNTPGHLVEGSWWGEEVKSPVQTLECPPGTALLPDMAISTGPWGPYTVINGLILRCAHLGDPHRKVVAQLTAGWPENATLRGTCKEEAEVDPKPFASGLRVIAGMRMDALGFICDVGPQDQARPVATVHFPRTPSVQDVLDLPLRRTDRAGFYAQLHVLNRQAQWDGATLELPTGDATMQWRPMTAQGLEVVSPVTGCAVTAQPDSVVLGHGGGDACVSPVLWVHLRGAAFTVTAGQAVEQGQVLGGLSVDQVLLVRAVGAHLVAQESPNGAADPLTPFSVVKGEGTRALVRVEGVKLPAPALDGGAAATSP